MKACMKLNYPNYMSQVKIFKQKYTRYGPSDVRWKIFQKIFRNIFPENFPFLKIIT
jgi:hypothetical protein